VWNTSIDGAVDNMKPPKDALTSKKSEWKQIEPFYSEVVSDARSVKDAWRNPTAHFRRQDDEFQAKKVLERSAILCET
jgi:hypothetical protein